MKPTDREIATVLAALRYWQEEILRCSADGESDFQAQAGLTMEQHFDEHSPLTLTEIDTLCERINFDEDFSLAEDLQRALFLDEETGKLDPDKEWDSETFGRLAYVVAEHGLIPDEEGEA